MVRELLSIAIGGLFALYWKTPLHLSDVDSIKIALVAGVLFWLTFQTIEDLLVNIIRRGRKDKD